ncbi:hypothetical protein BDV59DRAFT_199452 [Aspergillus ambiguus]|uniref:uncharacterized protein n=1 Tax=Aspergillus ambiguus TaxID=176160 RepID=UPI003CCD8CB3
MRPHFVSILCLFATGIYGQQMAGNNPVDTGNSFCYGARAASAAELSCGELATPMYAEGKGYRCCMNEDVSDKTDKFADKMKLYGDRDGN